MNPDVKSKWVAALRSGEYKQARGVLRDQGGYCVLGVLCDLHSKAHDGEPVKPSEKVGPCEWIGGGYRGEVGAVPLAVQDWADIPRAPAVGTKCKVKLSSLNDEGTPFSQLADLIEQSL